MVPATATLVNRTINAATGTNLPDAPLLQPSNKSEAEGMMSTGVALLLTPFAEANAAKANTATKAAQSTEIGSSTTVIGRTKDLQRLQAGEKSLLDRLPNQGSPKANWKQNSGVLREEMGRGAPIRDASPGDNGGAFLNAERNLLRQNGWIYDKKTTF